MKNTFVLILFILSPVFSLSAEIDYRLYMRTPVGANAEGGKQFQINNYGSRGNEFRLGNESTYGEAYFTTHILKPTGPNAPFFDANVTFAFMPPMNSQYNDTSNDGDNIHFIQAYAKGGNLDGLPVAFWAGKRFYRNADIFMDDFFYFANMNGSGGGVEEIPMPGSGTLSLAWLQHSDRTLQKGSQGQPTKQALDVRWLDYKLSDDQKLHMWLAQAWNTSGDGFDETNAPIQYKASGGTALGVRWQVGAHQNLAVLYGTGIMENLELDNWAVTPSGSSVDALERLRIVEHFVHDINPRITVHGALIAEFADSRKGSDSKSHWYSVGVRPLYRFTDHYHLSFSTGYSIVGAESEQDGAGKKFGDRTLFRATLAPEVALGKGYFDRPALRAYVTYSQWNNANRNSANPNSLKSRLNSQGIRAVDGSSDLVQFGVEAEVWF